MEIGIILFILFVIWVAISKKLGGDKQAENFIDNAVKDLFKEK